MATGNSSRTPKDGDHIGVKAAELLATAEPDPRSLYLTDFTSPLWCALEASQPTTGDPEPEKIAVIIGESLANPESGAAALATIAEYVSSCLGGCVPVVGEELKADRKKAIAVVF